MAPESCQLMTASWGMQLLRITLRAAIPFILLFVFTMTANRNFTWIEGIQNLSWKKEQLLSETCRWLNLLQCSCSEWERVESPMVISTNIKKQSEKWQNSSAYLHWRYKYPCMNICNAALEKMHQALLTATFPFSQVLVLAKTQAPCQIF